MKSLDKKKTKELDWEKVAFLFHNTYEGLATKFGYETRKDTKEFDPESNNGKLMIATCKAVISKTIQQQRKDLIKEIEGIKRLPNMAQNQNGNEYCSACGCPWDNIDNYCPDCATHNQALVDIIKILEKK